MSISGSLLISSWSCSPRLGPKLEPAYIKQLILKCKSDPFTESDSYLLAARLGQANWSSPMIGLQSECATSIPAVLLPNRRLWYLRDCISVRNWVFNAVLWVSPCVYAVVCLKSVFLRCRLNVPSECIFWMCSLNVPPECVFLESLLKESYECEARNVKLRMRT